jgi:predicted metal-dependent RNase
MAKAQKIEIVEKVRERLPKEAVSRIELEGSEIIVYTKSDEFFRSHHDAVRAVVGELKKRIEVRPEANLTID